MRIAFIAPDSLSIVIFCSTFSRILEEAGEHKIFTICDVDQFQEELKLLPVQNFSVPIHRYTNFLRDAGYFWNLLCLFRKNNFDVVVTFTTKPNVYAVIAARLAGVEKIVMAVRGLGRTFSKTNSLKEVILHFVVKTLYRLSSLACQKVWFTNIYDKQYFLSQGMVDKKKIIMTKNAVDLNKWSPSNISNERLSVLRTEFKISENNIVILMIARLVWSKGIREFIDAANILSLENPNLKFLLVAPNEKNSLDSVPVSYVRDAEKNGSFKWLEFRKDIFDLCALCDLAVLPSYYKEGGYPRALLEPMALGKPVIAADTRDCRAPVLDGENGFLVPPRDVAKLVERITEICSDKKMRESFGRKSLSLILDEYDDKEVVMKILSEINN
jgi:N,N'-diacetylbacillosaminyl-diphospho-undecaprenol alpha-1,3-N-acetylgalactosaminyltransferase